VYRDAQSELSLTFRWDGAGLWENSLGIRFPSIEYRNENGAYLGFLGISKGKRVLKINATARHVGGKLLTHRGEA